MNWALNFGADDDLTARSLMDNERRKTKSKKFHTSSLENTFQNKMQMTNKSERIYCIYIRTFSNEMNSKFKLRATVIVGCWLNTKLKNEMLIPKVMIFVTHLKLSMNYIQRTTSLNIIYF